jgi:hypothetical protein
MSKMILLLKPLLVASGMFLRVLYHLSHPEMPLYNSVWLGISGLLL